MVENKQQRQGLYLSLRWKLILPFILLTVAVLVIFLPATNGIISEGIEEESDRRLQQTADSVTVLLEQSEEQALLSANFVAAIPEVIEAGDDKVAIEQALLNRRTELDLQELSFYKPDFAVGDSAYYYGGPSIDRPFQSDTVIRDGLILDVIARDTAASSLKISPRSSEIIGVAPVHNSDGELQGIIVAVVYLDDSFMQQIGDVLGADVALVRDNKVIASTLDDPTPYEKFIGDGFIDHLDEHAEHVHAARSIEVSGEQQRLIAQPFVVDDETQGVIMVAQPIESLFTIQDDIREIIFIFSALLVVTSMLFALFTFFNFARPLAKLAEATNLVSAGNFSQDVQVNSSTLLLRDEISDLTVNFNSMTGTLSDLYTGLERRVDERTRELNQAMIELAEARDDALEANRTKSAFMANMSHELRTPLNAIIGYSNLVISGTYGDINEKQSDRLTRVLDNGQHLLALINDVLDLSKIEAGKMEVYLETFALDELLETIVRTAHTLMAKNQNKLVANISPQLTQMHSDVTKLRQVLFNLLSNAAKFTEQGTVTLDVTPLDYQAKPGIEFKVTDTGIGMSPEQLSKVFMEFTQADVSTTRKYGGTGLGLTISKRFCEMLGGYIEVSSEEGAGSIFTVWLPIESVAPKVGTGEMKKVATGTHDQIAMNKSIILVIDDDEAVLESIQHYLEDDHFHVITTNNGQDGLRLAEEYHPQVIMLDVLMPGMDGWAVLNKIKSTPALADIPVIMTTILSDRNMGYALGAADYVTKPVDKDQILRVVNRYRCQTRPCPILIVEDDASTRQMMRDMLETDGWQVNEAINGLAGLEALENIQPELIMLDLMMPQMNGFEFLRRLREDERWQSIPVVVVTAMDLTPEAQEELQLSVRQIIQKGSYTQEQLLEEVRRWVIEIVPE